MSYFVVFMRSGHGFTAPSSPAELYAQSYREVGTNLHFFRENKLVFQAPIVNVRVIERYLYQRDASKRVTKFNSRRAGAATMDVQETGYASAKGHKSASSESAGVVEQVSLSIVEPVPAHLRKKN